MPLRAAASAVTWAANGVDLREPLKPAPPADSHASTLPSRSVSDTIVLLNDVLMCAWPRLGALVVGRAGNVGAGADPRVGQQLARGRRADAVDVGQADLDALVQRDVDACDSRHGYPCRCLCRGLEQITSTAPWRRMI